MTSFFFCLLLLGTLTVRLDSRVAFFCSDHPLFLSGRILSLVETTALSFFAAVTCVVISRSESMTAVFLKVVPINSVYTNTRITATALMKRVVDCDEDDRGLVFGLCSGDDDGDVIRMFVV